MNKWELLIKNLQFSGKKVLADKTLINTTWLQLYPISNVKTLYIFKSDKSILTSKDGDVIVGKWEFIDNGDLLLITIENSSALFNCIMDSNDYLLLNKDGHNEPTFFVNYDKTKNLPKDYLNSYLSNSDSLPSLNEGYSHQNIFLFDKNDTLIPPRDPKVKDLLTDTTRLIRYNLGKFEELISHYSDELPVYLCHALNKRGEPITALLLTKLEMYARSKGYNSFKELSDNYRQN